VSSTDIKTVNLEKGCPNCEGTYYVRDYKLSRLICRGCGKVLEKDIKDMGPEWREYSQEEKNRRSRSGPPITEVIHDRGLSPTISQKNRDAKGNALSPDSRYRMYRLRKRNKSAKITDQKDRNLSTAFSEINRMSSQLGLPRSIREIASRIYRKAIEEDLIRGHSIEGISSAALYLACRTTETPRALKEIANVSYAKKRKIGRGYRYLSRELGIDLVPRNHIRFVTRFGRELRLSTDTITKAIDLVKRAREEKMVSGKSPLSIAAAVLYIAARSNGEARTQAEIAGRTFITAVTLRNRYEELVEDLELDLGS